MDKKIARKAVVRRFEITRNDDDERGIVDVTVIRHRSDTYRT